MAASGPAVHESEKTAQIEGDSEKGLTTPTRDVAHAVTLDKFGIQHLDDPLGKHRHKATDEAHDFITQHGHDNPISPEEERALVRKLDFLIPPIMMFTFMLAYIDKATLGTSAIFGIIQEYELGVGKRYSLSNSLFYIGFIPGNFLLPYLAQKFPIGKCCGVYTILWGVVCLLTVTVTNYKGLYAQRFVLGFIEGGITPCFLAVVGMWYKKSEHSARAGAWYGATGIAIILSCPIAVGLAKQASKDGWGTHTWKSFYYLWGSVTTLWGFVVLWLLPDSPMKAKFLKTDRERFIAVERLRADQTGTKATFQAYQLIEGLLDVRLWLLFFIAFGMLTVNGSIGAFQPILIRSLGFDAYQSTYLSMVTGAITSLAIWPSSWVASRFKNMRTIVQLVSVTLTVISFALLYSLPQSKTGGRLFAIYLLGFYSPTFTQAMAFCSSNFAGYTKKTWAASFLFVGYALGNIAGPLFFLSKEAPFYRSGFEGVLVCVCSAFLFCCIHGYLCIRENKRRDAMGDIAQVDRAFNDYTDKENLTFRYNY